MTSDATSTGTEWYESHREEFQAQRDASVSLLAKIRVAAEEQHAARQVVAVEQKFADEVDQLAAIRHRLDGGQPEDTLPKKDQNFLHGFVEAGKRRKAYGGSRRTRWPRAVASLPTPPPSASEHVVRVFVARRDEVQENYRATVMHCVMQDFRWYQELARRSLAKAVLKHAKFCEACDLASWSFLFDLPPFMDSWDRSGNFKPHKPTEVDPDAEPEPDSAADAD